MAFSSYFTIASLTSVKCTFLSSPPRSFHISHITSLLILNLFFLQPLTTRCCCHIIFSSRSAFDFYWVRRKKNIKKFVIVQKKLFSLFLFFIRLLLAHFPFTRKFRQIKFFFAVVSSVTSL